MLYFIGLGLGDATDITVKGLEIVKGCDRVYLEEYTSILTCGREALEKFYGRPVIPADRDMVEQGAAEILDGADVADVAFLVVGDPFGATTHADLALRAHELGIKTKAVHNASIMNAIGCCGLQVHACIILKTLLQVLREQNWGEVMESKREQRKKVMK